MMISATRTTSSEYFVPYLRTTSLRSVRCRGAVRSCSAEAGKADLHLVDVVAGQLGADPAGAHDQHAVADARELLGLRGNDDDGCAAVGEVRDGAQEGLPRVGVDPVGGVVEDQHLGLEQK